MAPPGEIRISTTTHHTQQSKVDSVLPHAKQRSQSTKVASIITPGKQRSYSTRPAVVEAPPPQKLFGSKRFHKLIFKESNIAIDQSEVNAAANTAPHPHIACQQMNARRLANGEEVQRCEICEHVAVVSAVATSHATQRLNDALESLEYAAAHINDVRTRLDVNGITEAENSSLLMLEASSRQAKLRVVTGIECTRELTTTIEIRLKDLSPHMPTPDFGNFTLNSSNRI